MNGCINTKKWAYLLGQSTTMKITDLPLEAGSLLMKSIEMLEKVVIRMGRGWRSLGDLIVSPFGTNRYCKNQQNP